MSTHLWFLLCAVASVQRGAAQAGTRPPDSVLLTSVTSLKNEGTHLKLVAKGISDELTFYVDVSGDLMDMRAALVNKGRDLLVEANKVRSYAENAISELQGQAPSYSVIQKDMADTVSEAGVFTPQINSYKAAMLDFINKVKAKGHPSDALMTELTLIAGYGDQLLTGTATVVAHAQRIMQQLQGGKVVG